MQVVELDFFIYFCFSRTLKLPSSVHFLPSSPFHFFLSLQIIQSMHPSSKFHLFSCRRGVFSRLLLLALHTSMTISWNSQLSSFLIYQFSDFSNHSLSHKGIFFFQKWYFSGSTSALFVPGSFLLFSIWSICYSTRVWALNMFDWFGILSSHLQVF